MTDGYAIEAKRESSATSRVADWLGAVASPGFVAAAVWGACILSFVLWHADYRGFFAFCNADDGAALHTDRIIAEGARPGRDFAYHYGLLPLLVGRAVFGLAGRTPLGMLFFLAAIFAIFSGGLVRVVREFRPTRLGTMLIALAAFHTTQQKVPTHAIEAAVLVWAVAFRGEGRNAIALALAAIAIFVKISMPVVVLAELIGLIVLDACRERRAGPLFAIAVVPVTLATGAVLCGWTLGWEGLRESLDPSSGSRIYRHFNLGFFREGRHFWAPAGHTAGWYVGTIAGVWLVGSVVLGGLAIRSTARIAAAVLRGATRDTALIRDEATVLATAAHFAFVLVFFGPSNGSAYYYTWVLLVGLAPALGQAQLAPPPRTRLTPASSGWIGVALALSLSLWTTLRAFATLALVPRGHLGQVTAPLDEVAEWTQSIAAARATGGGSIAAVAVAAGFELVDPTIREGRYWMLVPGQPRTPALDETVRLAESSDSIFVTKFDYPALIDIPELRPLLEGSERIHDGRYFFVLRPRNGAPGSL